MRLSQVDKNRKMVSVVHHLRINKVVLLSILLLAIISFLGCVEQPPEESTTTLAQQQTITTTTLSKKPSGIPNRAVDFEKIKVFDNTIEYTDSSLTFKIANVMMSPVIELTIDPSGDCESASSINVDTLQAAEIYTVKFTGCSPKSPGDTFSVPVTMTGNRIVKGETLSHIEKGVIEGTAK